MAQGNQQQQNQKNQKRSYAQSDSSLVNQTDNLPHSYENQRKFTSLQKLQQYFSHILKVQNLSKEFTDFDIQKDQIDLETIRIFQLLKIYEKQSKPHNVMKNDQKQQEILIDKQIVKLTKNYQNKYRSMLETLLVKSKKFSKVQTFTSKLIIHKMYPTNQYEIVKLQIQLLWYKTQVCILNQRGESPLVSSAEISASGSFGYIYFVNLLNEQIAIKCIPLTILKRNIENFHIENKIFLSALKQYFFVLLFSQLKIGPQAKKIGGFDLVVHQNSIQFATEICQNVQGENTQQISKNIWKMHMLQIVHRDIKPTNIMRSPTFQKQVFIDFGCTQAIKQHLGENTFSRFTGTTAYCSDQILALLKQREGQVDLYFNDLFGLQKSFSKDSLMGEFLQQQVITIPQTPYFQLYSMKSSLFNSDFQYFRFLWKIVKKRYVDHLEYIETELLRFFCQLNLITELRQFYWTQISQNIRDLDEFEWLNMIFKKKQINIWPQFCNNANKQQQFEHIIDKYNILKITNGNLPRKQRQIQLFLSNKANVERFLRNVAESLQKEQLIQQIKLEDFNEKSLRQITNFCMIVANYSSMSQRKYKLSVENKISACQLALKYFQKFLPHETKNFKLTSTSYNEKFISIAKFFQFYVFHIFKFLPFKYKDKQMVNAVLTMCLLGYTLYSNNAASYLLEIFICDQKEDTITGVQFQDKSEENNQEINVQKLIMHWQIQLITLFFNAIYFNNLKLESSEESQSKFQAIVKWTQYFLSKQQGEQYRQLFMVCSKFFDKTQVNNTNFSESIIDELQSLLLSPSLLNKIENSTKALQLYSLLCIYLAIFAYGFSKIKGKKIARMIKREMIFSQNSHKQIFPFMVFHILHKLQTNCVEVIIVGKIHDIIDCKQISIRFQMESQLMIALKRNDALNSHQAMDILRKQTTKNLVSFQGIILIRYSLKVINNYLRNEYFKHLPAFTEESYQILKYFYPVVDLCMQVGQRYIIADKISSQFYTIKCTQPTFVEIERLLVQIQIIRQFYFDLIEVGSVYQHADMFNYQQKDKGGLITTFDKIYPKLFLFFQKKQLQVCIVEKLLTFIDSNQNIKSTIQSSVRLLTLVLQIYMLERNTVEQIVKGAPILQNLCQQISSIDFSNAQFSYIFPKYKILFDYFQIKIFQTNYGTTYCEKLIQLFKIFSQNKSFSIFFKKIVFIRYLFNSFIYTHKPYIELISFFGKMTDSLNAYPYKSVLSKLANFIQNFFWCKCKQCFPRVPQNWDPKQLTLQLFRTVHLFKPCSNPYMALVYFYSLTNKRVETFVTKKFVIFIILAMPYLTKYARKLIIGDLYFHVYMAFQWQSRQLMLNKRGREGKLRNKDFPLQQMNERVHKRLQYSFAKRLKHGLNRNDGIDELVNKLLSKEIYFLGYKYPPLFKQLYAQKLRRYFEVKQNYKQSDTIKQFSKHMHFE